MVVAAHGPDNLEVEFRPGAGFAELERVWRALEAGAGPCFFNSWSWASSWVASLPPARAPGVFVCRKGERTVGLALLGRAARTRRGIVRSRGLYLNESGTPEFDRVTVEHNGLLIERGLEREVHAAFLAGCVERLKDWDELFVSCIRAADRSLWAGPAGAARLSPQQLHRAPFYTVDLAGLRREDGDYLSRLSSNTRAQLRRSLKFYGGEDALAVREAASRDEALEYLDALAELHQRYWRARGQPGAFSSKFTRAFHSNLVSTGFERGEIQLLRVHARGSVVGYLYNFVHRAHVYNYQSGIDYEVQDNKCRPGLSAHYKAVLWNLHKGHDVYDFLMGEQRYKRSLCTHEGEMLWLVLQKPRLRFFLENSAKRMKHSMARQTSHEASA